MKSPLVDAIRQAGGDSSTGRNSPDDEPTISDAGGPADDEQLVDGGELSLMESTVSIDSAEEDAVPPEGDATAGDHQDGADDDTSAHETAAFSEGAPARVAPAKRRPELTMLGRFAPLLCLLFAAGAVAAYLVYHALGGGYHRSDLALLSAQALAEGRLPETTGEDPGPPSSPFELAAGPRPSATHSRPPGRATGGVELRAGTGNVTTGPTRAANRATFVPSELQDEAYPHLQAAFAAYEIGEVGTAETEYRRALELAPRHPNALEGLAAILMKTDRRAEALEAFEQLLSVDPGNSAAAAALLAAREDSGTRAGSDIKHLVQRHPGSPQLRFFLGTFYASEARWPEARVEFNAAHRLDPGNADYLYNLAVALEHLGRTEEAGIYYRSALASLNATSTLDASLVSARLERLASAESAGEQGR